MMKLMLLCVATFAISGCASTGKVAPSASCASFEVIRPSRADTLETKRQVLAHNQTWRALCQKEAS